MIDDVGMIHGVPVAYREIKFSDGTVKLVIEASDSARVKELEDILIMTQAQLKDEKQEKEKYKRLYNQEYKLVDTKNTYITNIIDSKTEIQKAYDENKRDYEAAVADAKRLSESVDAKNRYIAELKKIIQEHEQTMIILNHDCNKANRDIESLKDNAKYNQKLMNEVNDLDAKVKRQELVISEQEQNILKRDAGLQILRNREASYKEALEKAQKEIEVLSTFKGSPSEVNKLKQELEQKDDKIKQLRASLDTMDKAYTDRGDTVERLRGNVKYWMDQIDTLYQSAHKHTHVIKE